MPRAARALRILVAAVALSGPLAARAEPAPSDVAPATAERVAGALFPETRGWPALSAYPEADAADLAFVRRIADSMRRGRGADGADCSPFLRLDDPDPARRPSFRKGRITGGATESLIHSGPSTCFEGNWSLIWRDMRDTGRDNQVALGQVLLRLRPADRGGQPTALLATPAGERSMVDEYVVATLGVRQVRKVSTRKGLALPADAVRAELDLTLRGDRTLQARPEAGEASPPDGLRDLPIARAGERVRRILAWRDGDGTAWSLVMRTVPREPRYDDEAYDAGWIRDEGSPRPKTGTGQASPR